MRHATRISKKTIRTKSSTSSTTTKLKTPSANPAEPQEFPIPHSILRVMYDAMIESRLFSQSRNLLPVISEATAIAAAAALHRTDTLAAPADGRTLYPVTHPETTIIPLNPAKIISACQLARRKRCGAVIAICPETIFRSPEFQQLLQEAHDRLWPLISIALSDDFFNPRSIVPEIDVDGHDAVAVFRVVSESLRRARNHRGPAIIHAHRATRTQTRDPLGDPLLRFERYLSAKGLTTRKLHVAHAVES